jgi:hypothetical protein
LFGEQVTDALGDTFIAEIVSRDRPCAVTNPTELEANAHLIAAAPDLLAALKALFADYKALADSGDAGHWSLEGLAVGQQALAAIAKAEGVS